MKRYLLAAGLVSICVASYMLNRGPAPISDRMWSEAEAFCYTANVENGDDIECMSSYVLIPEQCEYWMEKKGMTALECERMSKDSIRDIFL